MRRTFRMGVVSLLASAVAATSAVAGTPAAAGQTSASVDDSKIVCKGQTRVNSRFKDQVCRTRGQWEELRMQQRRDAQEMVDRPQIDTDRLGRGE